MNEDTKQCLIVCSAFAIVLGSLIWGIAWYNVTTTRAAIEAGLVEGSIQGKADAYWVKPEKADD